MMIATQFSEPLSYYGEGAVWSEAWGGLRCVDILCFAPGGSVSRHNVGTLAAMIHTMITR